MAKKRRQIKKTSHHETNFELQLTALIDTLVILLLFMLKTVSMDSLEIQQAGDLKLPEVTDGVMHGTGPILSINAAGIRWNGQEYLIMTDFKSSNASESWKALKNAIIETAKIEKDENKFNGKVFLEADKKTPFTVLSQALQIARTHGYKDVQFVGARFN